MNTKELEKQTTQLPTTVHALAVVDRASYELAEDYIKKCIQLEKDIRAFFEPSKKKGEFFKRAHMVTTLSKYGEHWLMDYKPFGPHNVLEGALEDLGRPTLDRIKENGGQAILFDWESFRQRREDDDKRA